MDNPKAAVRETKLFGKGVLAVGDIKKGEIITDWTGGEIYIAQKCTDLPKNISDYAIQFEEHKWIDTPHMGRFLNHSCEPNCGIRGLFQVVAMRDIKKGEWITFDYETTEDSDWGMECKCGTKSCRKLIGAYRNMPPEVRKRYAGYISEWLVAKSG